MTEKEQFEADMQRRHRSVKRTAGGEYSTEAVELAWAAWQASRKQALEEAMKACERLGDHEQDMGREKEAFACDSCCDAIRSLTVPMEKRHD